MPTSQAAISLPLWGLHHGCIQDQAVDSTDFGDHFACEIPDRREGGQVHLHNDNVRILPSLRPVAARSELEVITSNMQGRRRTLLLVLNRIMHGLLGQVWHQLHRCHLNCLGRREMRESGYLAQAARYERARQLQACRCTRFKALALPT